MIARVVMGVFFGVVTPIALVFRVTGRDALERTLDRGAATEMGQNGSGRGSFEQAGSTRRTSVLTEFPPSRSVF